MLIGIDASRANAANKTGTEWYSWHLIRELAPLLKNHRLRLYLREAPEEGLAHLGPHVEVRVLRWPPAIVWSHLRLAWELLIHPPDVLFVPADTVPIIHPPKTYTTIHDVAFERFPELYQGRSVQRRLGWLRPFVHAGVRLLTGGRYSASERDYHRWSARHAIRSSRAIVTVSEFSKREIVETLGAQPERIVVTHLGIAQPEVFEAISEETCRQALGALQITQPYLIFTGRLEKKKNIAHLLRAYKQYSETRDQPAELVLVGQPGYGWDEALKIQQSISHPQSVHRLGWQDDATIKILEKKAVAMLFVSRYEGFGLPPLESQSAGVPVIASPCGSLPEVLGATALFVGPDDVNGLVRAMASMAEDAAARQALIQRGLANARKFTWRACALATLPVLLGAAIPLQKGDNSGRL